jgi:hypothetical protein
MRVLRLRIELWVCGAPADDAGMPGACPGGAWVQHTSSGCWIQTRVAFEALILAHRPLLLGGASSGLPRWRHKRPPPTLEARLAWRALATYPCPRTGTACNSANADQRPWSPRRSMTSLSNPRLNCNTALVKSVMIVPSGHVAVSPVIRRSGALARGIYGADRHRYSGVSTDLYISLGLRF